MSETTVLAGEERCRSCDAKIVWAASWSTGKWMPLDAEPVSPGPGCFALLRGRGAPLAISLSAVRGADAAATERDREALVSRLSLHVSHFATCPNAAQHRGGR